MSYCPACGSTDFPRKDKGGNGYCGDCGWRQFGGYVELHPGEWDVDVECRNCVGGLVSFGPDGKAGICPDCDGEGRVQG